MNITLKNTSKAMSTVESSGFVPYTIRGKINRETMLMQRYVVLILIFFSGFLYGEDLRQIDLQSAKELALRQNPQYQSAEADFLRAKWGKTNAFSAFLPNLSLSGNIIYMDPARKVVSGGQELSLNQDMRSFALNLNQPIFLGGRLYQAYKIADLGYSMADFALQNMKQELIMDLEQKYYAALQMQDILEIASREYEQASSNLQLAELKQTSGLISRADYLRFEANLVNKEIALSQAETAYNIALRDLANFLGSSEILAPVAMQFDESELLPYSELDRGGIKSFTAKVHVMAEDQNYSLQILDGQVEIADRSHKMAKASFMPSLNLVGSRQYEENGIDRYDFQATNQIMLNLSVPLLPQIGSYASTKQAYYEAQRARFLAQSANDGVRLGIDAAITELISNARRVRSAQLSLQITTDLYDQLQERFRLNLISTLELMDAELMLSSARLAHTRAYYDFYAARLKLLSLLGTDDVAVLLSLLDPDGEEM